MTNPNRSFSNGLTSTAAIAARMENAATETPTVPSARTGGNVVDALELWDAEAGSDALMPLSTIRLDRNERLLIPFTTSLVQVNLHYLDFASLRGYVRCQGDGCLLCRIGRQSERRDLLPIYDIVDRSVTVLPISPSMRPHALRPQLAPVLRLLGRSSGALVVSIRNDGPGRYDLNASPLPDGADDGAAVIRAFQDRLERGEVDLASVFQELLNEELAMIDEVRALMAVKRIAL